MPTEAWRNRIVSQADVDPTQLLAHPDNWRVHPAFQEAALERVLLTVGWVQRVIVNTTTGHVLDGHLRVALAIRREEPTVPVNYVELTEDEERIILATLDPIGAMADRDYDKARELSQSIIEQSDTLPTELRVLFESELDTEVARRALFTDQMSRQQAPLQQLSAGQLEQMAIENADSKVVTLYFDDDQLRDFQRLITARRNAGAESAEAAVMGALLELPE